MFKFKNLQNQILFKLWYPMIYNFGKLFPLEKGKIIFIENNTTILNDNAILLWQKLQNQKNTTVHVHFLKRLSGNRVQYFINCTKLIWDSATAQYVFLTDALNIFSGLSLRKESIFTQLWHGCGAFKKFGCSLGDNSLKGRMIRSVQKLNYSYLTYFTVSSPNVVWAFQEATGLAREKILPIGISRTDLFFDTNFFHMAYKKLQNIVPSVCSKKVILYAPTFRGTSEESYTPQELSISHLYKELSNSFCLIIKHHPSIKNRPIIPEDCRDFAYDLTDVIDIQSLLVIANICITDYSSLIFEYSLLEKPLIFFAFDLDDYCKNRGFFYTHQELMPGPICSTTEQLIKYIQTQEYWFDIMQIRKFRNYFMNACDGKSTERIIKTICSDFI